MIVNIVLLLALNVNFRLLGPVYLINRESTGIHLAVGNNTLAGHAISTLSEFISICGFDLSNAIFFLTATVFGDPHVYTFDHTDYTFNGLGEYVLVRADSPRVKLDVQVLF